MFTCTSRVTKRTADQGRPMRSSCEVLETRRLLAVVASGPFGQGNILQFADADGDIVRMSLTGGGTGEVIDGSVQLSGTTERSVLTATVRRAGGDGLVTISGINSAGPLKAINAGAVIVEGDISLNTTAPDDEEPVEEPVEQPGDPASYKPMAITLGEVRNGSIDTGGQAISTLKLRDWAYVDGSDQQVIAPYIGTVLVSGTKGVAGSGDLGANLVLADGDARNMAIRTLKVAGTVSGIEATTGAIGTLQAGGIDGVVSALYLGTVRTTAGKGEGAADGIAIGEIRALGTAPQANKPAINTIQLAGTEALTIRASEGSLGTITIKGNAIDTSIYSATGGAKSLRVGGQMAGGKVQTLDSIPTITLGAMENTDILVGVNSEFGDAFAPDAAAFENSDAAIRTFTVGKRGSEAVLVTGTNHLSAPKLGKASVYYMESDGEAGEAPASLQIYTLDTPKNPGSIRYTSFQTSENSFNWSPRPSVAWPETLQHMLTVWTPVASGADADPLA